MQNALADMIIAYMRERQANQPQEIGPAFETRNTSLPRDRVVVNQGDLTAYKPVDPTTWTDDQIKSSLSTSIQQHRDWMEKNGGSLVDMVLGSPYKSQIDQLSKIINARTNKNRVLPPL